MEERSSPNIGRREARKAERRAAIVEIAWRHFLEHGYDRTSMSVIVEEMGGSKGTLWSYFLSKEELFAATMEAATLSFRSTMAAILDLVHETHDALMALAEQFIIRITSADAVALQRLIVGEIERFPKIGCIFYNRAPAVAQAMLAKYVASQVLKGTLPDRNSDEAARLFRLVLRRLPPTRYLEGCRAGWRGRKARSDDGGSVFLRCFGPIQSEDQPECP